MAREKRFFRVWSVVVVVFLCFQAAIRAAEYHVDAAVGDDARSGAEAQSPETPWASLARAAQEVRPGDRVWVHEGVYTGGLSVTTNGAADAPIVFSGVGKVVIRNTRTLPRQLRPVKGLSGVWSVPDPGPVTAIFEDPKTCRILIEMYRAVKGREELGKKHGGPVFFYDSDARVLYLKPFTKPTDPANKELIVSRLGTALSVRGDYVAVEGFRVEFAGGAVYLGGSHDTARRIWAYHCGAGFNLAGPGATVEYCVVQACRGGIQAGVDCIIRNNTFYGTRTPGVGIPPHASGRILNNIFWCGGVSGGNLHASKGIPEGLVMDHNVWRKYSNSRGRMSLYVGETLVDSLSELRKLGQGQHSLQVAPLFVRPDPVNPDFTLQTRAAGYPVDSPCINAGTPPGTDIGAMQVETPVPEALTVRKAGKGVRVRWKLPYLSDTIIAGFYVYRSGASDQTFKEVARIADPAAREFVDPAAQAGFRYYVTSYRPGGLIQSEPSAAVEVK